MLAAAIGLLASERRGQVCLTDTSLTLHTPSQHAQVPTAGRWVNDRRLGIIPTTFFLLLFLKQKSIRFMHHFWRLFLTQLFCTQQQGRGR